MSNQYWYATAGWWKKHRKFKLKRYKLSVFTCNYAILSVF